MIALAVWLAWTAGALVGASNGSSLLLGSSVVLAIACLFISGHARVQLERAEQQERA